MTDLSSFLELSGIDIRLCLHEGNTEEEKNGYTSSLNEIYTGVSWEMEWWCGGGGGVTPPAHNPFLRQAPVQIFKRRRERFNFHL
jgi:hypothetical protein